MSELLGAKMAITTKWEEHRDVLMVLYLSQNMTLKNIRKVMAQKYNFKAS
jgi:hypothetical protein